MKDWIVVLQNLFDFYTSLFITKKNELFNEMALSTTFHASLIAFFCTSSVSGQNKPCNNFACAYLKAENFLKHAQYQKALDNLDSAEGYLTDTNTKEKEQIKQLRRRLFVAIEKEKEDARK